MKRKYFVFVSFAFFIDRFQLCSGICTLFHQVYFHLLRHFLNKNTKLLLFAATASLLILLTFSFVFSIHFYSLSFHPVLLQLSSLCTVCAVHICSCVFVIMEKKQIIESLMSANYSNAHKGKHKRRSNSRDWSNIFMKARIWFPFQFSSFLSHLNGWWKWCYCCHCCILFVL